MAGFTRAFLGLVVIAALLASVLFLLIRGRGFSAREEPGGIEAAVALRLRSVMTPRSARDLRNPVAPTPEAIRAALEHYADHCAVCHANDGSGNTDMGRGLYPRPPDLRLPRTQSLADGELFYIIEEGIRFTGMPGWGNGTAEGETASWQLVQFIRHLPRLSEGERQAMEQLNPRSPDEIRQEIEEERFLSGRDAPNRRPPPHRH
ncbi:MAG TPA: c-type cytochrome [Vicinamibacterales bacterium]|nr:c-type cytochrome [Vicinamibacterales bacterium]